MRQEPERKGTQITVVEHQAPEQAETKNKELRALGHGAETQTKQEANMTAQGKEARKMIESFMYNL
jgi:hypothetical protein